MNPYKRGEVEQNYYQSYGLCVIKNTICNRNGEKSLSLIKVINKKIKRMQTEDLIQEIQRLPLAKRFYVVEETLKSIKKEELEHQMELAVEELYIDYTSDKELTAFTTLDLEHFYESK